MRYSTRAGASHLRYLMHEIAPTQCLDNVDQNTVNFAYQGTSLIGWFSELTKGTFITIRNEIEEALIWIPEAPLDQATKNQQNIKC